MNPQSTNPFEVELLKLNKNINKEVLNKCIY